MGSIEDGIEILAARLAAIARQIEDNGPDMAEAWVAEHHDDTETRELLILAMILQMEGMRERGVAPPGY